MTMRERLVEAAARAMSPFSWSDAAPKNDHHETMRDFALAQAERALDAILAELREPDEAMVEASKDCGGFDDAEIFQAMLATVAGDG